jgi:hypothetical protein
MRGRIDAIARTGMKFTVTMAAIFLATAFRCGWSFRFHDCSFLLPFRIGESITVGMSSFAPRKPRSFAERKAALLSSPILRIGESISARRTGILACQEATDRNVCPPKNDSN